ncbi:MAG: hypothetical protein ABI091_04760 [Ferruginibacter sp.]
MSDKSIKNKLKDAAKDAGTAIKNTANDVKTGVKNAVNNYYSPNKNNSFLAVHRDNRPGF